MKKRDWLETMFLESIKKSKPDLEDPEQIVEIVQKLMPDVIDLHEKYIRKNSKRILKERNKDMRHFRKNLKNEWETAFDQLDNFIAFNLEYGMIVSESYEVKQPNDVKFSTLKSLHARACQMAFEVLELIKSGFADGALARWRSLHEISVMANFLENGSEELCQRYLDYYFVENFSEMKEYQKNCEKLGCEPLSEEEFTEAQDDINKLGVKYGDDFLKPHGWIGDALPKRKRNFAGIEETVEFRYMRSFYKMANNSVHSGSKGFLYKLGTAQQGNVLLAGPSNYGFADPAQNAAFSLFQTTLTLSSFESYLEDALYIEVGWRMFYELSENFVNIQKSLEE